MARMVFFVAAALMLAGTSVRAEPVLKVVTTTAHIADVAAAVGGDRVTVESLLGPGVDPHLYKPTPPAACILKRSSTTRSNRFRKKIRS